MCQTTAEAELLIEKILNYQYNYSVFWKDFDDTFTKGVETFIKDNKRVTVAQMIGLQSVMSKWKGKIPIQTTTLPNVYKNKTQNNNSSKVFKSSKKVISKNQPLIYKIFHKL